MIRVQKDFQDRVAEIEAYFEFIGNVDAGATLLLHSDGKSPAYQHTPKADLLRTFRASGFLLIYNLMESTVTNAIEAIFDELASQGVSFDDCSVKVRVIVLKNLKAMGTKDGLPILTRIATEVIAKTFRKDEIVSGNVDADKIRQLAADYGFETPKVPQVWQQATNRGFPVILPSGGRLNGDGSTLLTVKDRRNKLAHGNSSFADVGRDFSQEDIVRIKCEVIAYLEAVLANVADYIRDQKYRL